LVQHTASAWFSEQARIIFRLQLRRLTVFARRRHRLQRCGLKGSVEALAHLFVGRARFESAHHIQPPDARFGRRAHNAVVTAQQRLYRQRKGNGWLITYLERPVESGWCNTDDGKRLLIESELLANDAGI